MHIAIVSAQESASVTLVGVALTGGVFNHVAVVEFLRIFENKYIVPTRLSVVETRDPPPLVVLLLKD